MAQEQEKRIYLGRGKRVKNYDLINITVCVTDLPNGAVFEYNGKKYLKLVVGGKKEIDQWGNTHSVWLNTFKPDGTKSQQKQSPGTVSDIPW